MPFQYESGWNSRPVLMLRRTENILFVLLIEPRFLGRPARNKVSMPAHSADSSDITSEERPAADFSENMNTGNVNISGV